MPGHPNPQSTRQSTRSPAITKSKKGTLRKNHEQAAAAKRGSAESPDALATQVTKLRNHVAITRTAMQKSITVQTQRIKANQKTISILQAEVDAHRELLEVQSKKVAEIEAVV